MKSLKEKKIDWKILISGILLVASFLIVVVCGWVYIKNNTNFIEQANSLLEEKDQLINNNVILWWSFGILLFWVALLLSLKDIWKVFWFFVWEFLLIMGSVLFIIGIMVNHLKLSFRVALILSSFVIYYSVYKAKEVFDLQKKKGI